MKRFAYDTLTERRVTPADARGRLSIAVFLDAGRVDAKDGASISTLVRAAAGADLGAGDEVAVQAVTFAPSPHPSMQPVTAQAPPLSRAVMPAVVVCALALFGVASLPAGALRNRAPLSVGVRHRVDARVESLARGAARRLHDESPQAAAYVVAALEPDVRGRYLDLLGRARRDEIERFLEIHRR